MYNTRMVPGVQIDCSLKPVYCCLLCCYNTYYDQFTMIEWTVELSYMFVIRYNQVRMVFFIRLARIRLKLVTFFISNLSRVISLFEKKDHISKFNRILYPAE